ncbi:hypothetical protein PTKIN_Ptkin12aG0112200 [Pterospermum kingtungense]
MMLRKPFSLEAVKTTFVKLNVEGLGFGLSAKQLALVAKRSKNEIDLVRHVAFDVMDQEIRDIARFVAHEESVDVQRMGPRIWRSRP